jgi:hypothetical protein
MEQVITIGLDLAKNVFQVHGIDAAGKVLVRRQLRRGDVLRFFGGLPRCLVGMEACATARHWARELTKLGHTVRLMPPASVKPYVKRGKTDVADAEAIAEAVTRPTMRFVGVKSADQQAALMLHKVRDLLVRQRTMLINALRGHLAEFGITAARGPGGVTAAIISLHEAQNNLPELARRRHWGACATGRGVLRWALHAQATRQSRDVRLSTSTLSDASERPSGLARRCVPRCCGPKRISNRLPARSVRAIRVIFR